MTYTVSDGRRGAEHTFFTITIEEDARSRMGGSRSALGTHRRRRLSYAPWRVIPNQELSLGQQHPGTRRHNDGVRIRYSG